MRRVCAAVLLFLATLVVRSGLAQTAPQEVRGVWCYVGTGSGFSTDPVQGPIDAKAFVDRLADAGFNLILPWVKSDYVAALTDAKYRKAEPWAAWDSLGVVINEAKARGMHVHMWFGFTEGKSPLSPEFDPNHGGDPSWSARRMLELPAPYGVSETAHMTEACPQHPGERQFEINMIDSVLQRYPSIDAVQIEEPGYRNLAEECLCDTCRSTFSLKYGMDLISSYTSSSADDFRCAGTTAFMSELKANLTTQPNAPPLACNGGYNWIQERTLGRDWHKWAHSGLLNYYAAQLYNNDLLTFEAMETRVATDQGPVPVLAGVGVSWQHSDLSTQTNSPSMVVQQVFASRQFGAKGVILFYGQALTDQYLNALKVGPFSQPATYGFGGGFKTPIKKLQTISLPLVSSRPYGSAPSTIIATSSSGLPVTLTVTAPATMSGNTLSVPSAGSESVQVIVTASQNGDGTYDAAPNVTQVFTLTENSKPKTSAIVSPTPNSEGWNNQAARVIFSATDDTGGSGVKELHFSVNGGPETVIQGSGWTLPVQNAGTTTISYHAVDSAGNAEPPQSVTIKLDLSAPKIVATPSRPPDHNGWYNQPVSFSIAGSDNNSGVASFNPTAPLDYSTGDSALAGMVGAVTNRAGTTRNQVVPFKYDATPPTIYLAGVSNGNSAASFAIDISASDHGSGSNLTLLVSLLKDGVQVYSNTVSATAPHDGPHTLGLPDASQDGNYELDVECQDEAGNISKSQAKFVVRQLSPDIQFQSPVDWGYFNSPQPVNFSVAKGISTTTQMTEYFAGGNQGPFNISSGFVASTEGAYWVHSSSTNVAATGIRDLHFVIDKTPPVLRAPQFDGVLAPNPSWYLSAVQVGLSASDPNIRNQGPAGVVPGSGVAQIAYYTTGAQVLGSSSSPLNIDGNMGRVAISNEGITTFVWWAVDKAGNASAPSVFAVKIDATPPTITAPAPITLTASGPAGAVVNFPKPAVFDKFDSAPSYTYYPPSGSTIPPGVRLATVVSTNSAGLESSANFWITVGNMSPTLTQISPSIQTALATGIQITATGSNFMPNSVVTVNGTPVPTTYAGPTKLIGFPDDSFFVVSGSLLVRVSTPGPGGGQSDGQAIGISRVSQSVRINPIAGVTYGAAPFAASGTASSGLPLDFRIVAGPATASGNTVTLTGAGQVEIQAYQPGDGTYAPTGIAESFMVYRAKPKLTITGATVDFDGNPHPAQASLSGLPGDALGSPAISYSPGGSSAPTQVGSYVARASYAGSPNYLSGIVGAVIKINPRLTIKSVLLTRATATGGTPVLAYVALDKAAYVGGFTIHLSTNVTSAGGLTQTSVTVPAGSTVAPFSLDTNPVSASTPVTITAIDPVGVSASATVTVLPPILKSLSILPSTVIGGKSGVSGAVQLTGMAATGTAPSLTASSSVLTVPANAPIPTGTTGGSFAVSAAGVDAPTTVTVTATLWGVARTCTVTVTPAVMQSVVPNQTTVTGGSPTGAQVNVTGEAGPSGLVISLANPGGFTMPAIVTIPAGQRTARFALTPPAVSTTTTFTLRATCSGTSASASITVKPGAIANFSMLPTTVIGGTNGAGGAVQLSGAATAGTSVALKSASPAVVVPASMPIPTGAKGASFAIATHGVDSPTPVSVTASFSGTTMTAQLTLTPAVMQSVVLNQTSVIGGLNSGALVNLTGEAGPSGTTVNLFSTGGFKMPASVMVPAGARNVRFAFTAPVVSSSTTYMISASCNGASRATSIRVLAPVLSSVSASPNTVVGGTAMSVVVRLSGPAPAGGIAVSLSGTDAKPGTLVIPAGATAASASMSTQKVSQSVTGTVTATSGSQTVTSSNIVIVSA